MDQLLRIRLSLILISLFTVAVGYSQDAAQHLSDTEADAIVQAQETAKAERQAARIAELEAATLKSEGRSILPNGQEVIIREVEPPQTHPTLGATFMPPVEVKQKEELTPKQRDQLQELQTLAQKEHATQMLSATVYDREVTRVSWSHDSEPYVVFTNVDFNYLSGTHSVETETQDYTFFLGIGHASRANNPYPSEVIPPSTTFSPDRSEYILAQGDPANAEATAGLEVLLAHYDAHLPELKIQLQRREALTAAKKRYDAANPKEPEPFIMQFWIPEKDDSPKTTVRKVSK
jgi:hypothetical protein